MSVIHRAFIENEAALRRLLARYLPRQQDIEDVTQDTYLHGFIAETERKIRAPKAYLFRIAKNLALNALKKKSATTTEYIEDFDTSDVLLDSGQVSVDDQASDRQRLVIVSEAILTLPPKCRRAFVMRKVDGLSYKDIARQLQLSESTVEKHVATGLQKCVDVLHRQGHDPSDFGVKRKSARSGSKPESA